MRKILLFNSMLFIFNTVFGQINFEDKVNIYDFYSLSVKMIYDDFDNDNDLDIIKYGTINSSNVLLQKNENGYFNANPSILIDSGKNPIISLDLNNDDFPDIITYNSYKNIGVLYNLQNDTFSEEQKIANFTGSYTIDPLKFDYNSDGFMDLILIDKSNGNNDAYVLLNNQSGGLEPAQFLFSLGFLNSIYKIHDIENDGDFDFYIKDDNELKIYLNDNGNFNNPYILQSESYLNSYGIMDFDGNGIKDILYWKNESFWVKYFDYDEVKNEFVILKDIMEVDNIPFNSNSTFTTNSIYIKNEENGIYTVYVALETTQNHSNIYKFDIQDGVFGVGQIVLANFEVNTLDLVQFNFLDLNNDDNLDFTFTTHSSGNLNMIFINNDINESNNQTICIQQTIIPNEFSVIDMNGDGIEDICVGTQYGLAYFEKTSNNELSEMQNLIGVISNPNASSNTNHHITDFNNDGLGDVIDFVNYANYVKIYKNLGNDNFEFIQSISLPNNFLATDVSFADIDSDGFKDLIFYKFNESPSNNGFYWVKNNNGIDFQILQPLIINGVDNISPATFAFDDFNNDGETDLLVLNYYYENNQWISEMNLLENENGQFSGNSLAKFNGSYGRSHIKIKDLDQDGDLDFFVYDINKNPYRDYSFLFFKNNGQNNFESIMIENLNIEDIEFSDNDGDGFYEIYAWNYDASSYMNNIFYYRTTDYLNFHKVQINSYSAYHNTSDPYTRGDLLLYDYNNDGKDDLFIDNFSSFYGLISVYKNVSETLGIEEIDNNNNLNQLQIYPNPFVNSVSWNSKENEAYNLQLFSQNGKLLFEKTTLENSLDLSTFNSGIYFFAIKEMTSAHERIYKIIKK